ncbi:MAG: dipicolinate synthase subunit B [Clostridiales bacterium 43-6]|nr:MAG: dipicolinate synthase subunit B [Clostridiales bacterium 43-6]
MNSVKVGFAMCGSFCTFAQAIPQMKALVDAGADVLPIMSPTAAGTDTRFGAAKDICAKIEGICGKKIITTISEAEPVGPKKLLDLLIIEPCTGNTLSKLANGITDTSVTMAAKAHLRNSRPVLIGVATNDGLSASAKNLGILLNTKNIFFIPMSQDDPTGKPSSLICNFDETILAAHAALDGRQLQPVFS